MVNMGRIHPERPDTDPFDRSVTADVLLRQEPEEEKTKRKATAMKMTMTTTKTTTATPSERALIYFRG
jgi:hypothetical protein